MFSVFLSLVLNELPYPGTRVTNPTQNHRSQNTYHVLGQPDGNCRGGNLQASSQVSPASLQVEPWMGTSWVQYAPAPAGHPHSYLPTSVCWYFAAMLVAPPLAVRPGKHTQASTGMWSALLGKAFLQNHESWKTNFIFSFKVRRLQNQLMLGTTHRMTDCNQVPDLACLAAS